MKFFILVTLTICLGFLNKSYAQEKLAPKKESVRQEPKNFLIGAEVRNYIYSEPGFVSHEGLLFGIWGEWLWTSGLGDGKIYGNLFYGALTYNGSACNLSGTVCNPLTATTHDLITKINTRLEYKLSSVFQLFLGAGYRYLYDKGEGSSFYTRTGQWVYIPVGAALNMDSSLGNLLFELEYDYTFYGVVKSNLSEVSSTLNDVTSNQKGGYGLVATAGIQINESLNAYVVYESWNANDSDVMESGGQSFIEPANNSQSYGIKLGYMF